MTMPRAFLTPLPAIALALALGGPGRMALAREAVTNGRTAPRAEEASHRAVMDGSATLPVDDPAWLDLERLDAMGLLPDFIWSQRPLSRREIGRVLAQASLDPRAAGGAAAEIVARLRRRFSDGPAGGPAGLSEARIGAGYLRDEPQSFPRSNGVGEVAARKQPLTADRGGRDWAPDLNGWIETRHQATLGPNLAVAVAPRLWLGVGERTEVDGDLISQSTRGEARLRWQALYGRWRLGPAAILVGRDGLAWGPSPEGGLLLSANARPLDMALITHESPFRLPGFLRHAGANRWLGFVSRLGHDRVLPNSLLVGMRASFRPGTLVELGFGETLVFAGQGAPTSTVIDYLWEFFPAGRLGTDVDLADHRFSFDVRAHVWPGHITGYGELVIEDAREGNYEDVTGRRAGLFLPAVGPGGRMTARLEYTFLPALTYRHGRWTTGYSREGRILGDELGPDATAIRFTAAGCDDRERRWQFDLTWEERQADQWAQKPDPTGVGYDAIYRIEDLPGETRWRAGAQVDWPLGGRFAWRPEAAIERIVNAGYVEGTRRTGLLTALELRYRFDR